jgi:hypothetical protein
MILLTKQILILTENDDCNDLSRLSLADYDALVLAFWASPEFLERVKQTGAKECWRLNEFVKDYTDLVHRAYRLARDFILQVPRYRNVNPLLGFENTVANAFLIPLIAVQVLHDLDERCPHLEQLVFVSRNDTQRAFEVVARNLNPRLSLQVLGDLELTKRHHTSGRLGAWLNLAREARRDQDWSQILWAPIEVLDWRYIGRQRVWKKASVQRGGIFFYSSYVNYSRTLAKHAKNFDTSSQWVINNHSAQVGLPKNVPAHYLWQFGSSIQDTSSLVRDAFQILANVSDRSDGFPLHAILQADHQIAEVFQRVLPLVLAEIDLMDSFLDTAQPNSIWTANQWGSECALIQLAHQKHIPVTQVQHGVLEQYYNCAPIYSDRFLVWGNFWKQAITSDEQSKVVISNPGFEVNPIDKASTSEKTRVTFFTAPAHVALFWNPSVALWETVTMLNEMIEQGHSVTVRVHPADRIDAYQQAWVKHCGGLPADVSFDKGGSLEPVLAKTDVAIMAFSTVFLNCLASEIPVVGTGWYPFMWQAQLAKSNYIRFSDSIANVEHYLYQKYSELNWDYLLDRG